MANFVQERGKQALLLLMWGERAIDARLYDERDIDVRNAHRGGLAIRQAPMCVSDLEIPAERRFREPLNPNIRRGDENVRTPPQKGLKSDPSPACRFPLAQSDRQQGKCTVG